MASRTQKKKGGSRSGSRQTSSSDAKSVEEFQKALERSITVSRERLQEVFDDAVERGRMTRTDANKLISDLVARGRKQSEDLVRELERALETARKEVEGRARKVGKEVEKRGRKARRSASKRGGKARRRVESELKRGRRAAVDAADEPLARADKERRKRGLGDFPISAYDELTAAQIKKRISDLTKAEARKVRTHEKDDKARKSILDAIEERLAE